MDKDEQLFAQLMYIFYSTAMQGMGKILHPVSNKIERNMEQAQNAIDMLEMIRTKTKGNLSPETDRLLNTYLTDLRLNYVEEANK
jgi:hypothetical protein